MEEKNIINKNWVEIEDNSNLSINDSNIYDDEFGDLPQSNVYVPSPPLNNFENKILMEALDKKLSQPQPKKKSFNESLDEIKDLINRTSPQPKKEVGRKYQVHLYIRPNEVDTDILAKKISDLGECEIIGEIHLHLQEESIVTKIFNKIKKYFESNE